MLDQALKDNIDNHVELIKYSSRAMKESSERATSFLVMVALLADAKRACEEDKVKLNTIVLAAKAQAWSKATAVQVTEKKIMVDNDSMYNDLREALEQCEHDINQIKTYMEIFNNAHIAYRNFAKE